jgi:hypothetical protein
VRPAGHVGIPVPLGRETLTHYFSYFSGPGVFSMKKHAGTRYTELVLLHPV